ncbi:MAG: flagellar basal body L-ring protein FlgH [Candidatus Acidiferrum sp.]
MTPSRRRMFAVFFLAAPFFAVLIFLPPSIFAGTKKPKPDPTATVMDDYLKQAREMNPAAPSTPGSLWVPTGSLATFALDYKALHVGDLILINLADTFSAANTGENSQSRAFSTTSGITGLLGAIGAKNRLANLLGGASTTTLDGKGASTLSSNVTLNLAAQVLEVLPNGVLVVQAARDFLVGNDRQIVVIRGLVRPGDLGANNSIASASIANLEVEIKGKGAVAEASRQPNVVVRTLLKFLTF